MTNSSNVFQKSFRFEDEILDVATINDGFQFNEKYYCREIKYDNHTQPIWDEKEPSACRCGRLDCKNCKMAFDIWAIDQIQNVFSKDPKRQCSIKFRMPVFREDNPTMEEARNRVIEFFHMLDCDCRMAVGVVDAVVDSVADEDTTQICTMHCILITTLLSEREIRHIQSSVRTGGFYFQLELSIPLYVEWSDEIGPEPKWIMPFDFAAWRLNMKQIAISEDRMKAMRYDKLMSQGFQTDRIFFFNVPNIERKVYLIRG